jgi:hypothetical protein
MSASPPDNSSTWRHVLGVAWVFLIATLYFLRQVPPQWPKIYERFVAPLLGK